MPTSDIYQFEDPVDFLALAFDRKRLANPRFSLRAWARQLGYANPSYLGQVLKRQRRLKLDFAKKLGRSLPLSMEERSYFETLVLYRSAKSEEERALCNAAIERLKRKGARTSLVLSHDKFRLIADGLHFILLEAVHLRAFDGTLEGLHRALEGVASKSKVSSAVDRLLRLGLLQRDASGRIARGTELSLLFDEGVPDEAVCAFHSEALERAKPALREQSVDERDFRTSTVAIAQSSLPRVREILKRAHEEILALSAPGRAEAVYQIQTTAFRVSKRIQ